ncbi:hypothetical protein [Hymenobacter nivis]|uniref:Uncharacterized protein n=1 Tax=Hymenobacter nivis TaxID=1850093 RepID=A0A2Z3GHQ9_9BACT|nr:hypothetical protein [Hymenobacter nivis]AWM31332.1 hypothetical protein DDQ68_00150 [Hymenobacter nivis]
MTDFLQFRNLAKAAFPHFNISAMIWEKEEAKSLNALRFRLKATSQKIETSVTVEAYSAAAAVEELRVALAKARRTFEVDGALRDISRRAGGLTEWQAIDIRAQLTKCPLHAFDKLVATLRHAALEAGQQQAA